MAVRIYRPTRSAMQSGQASSKDWVLEFDQVAPREIDPLMGWTSSSDMHAQLQMSFDTRDEAVAYAEQNGLAYRIEEPKVRRQIKKSYSDNFKYGRRTNWTH